MVLCSADANAATQDDLDGNAVLAEGGIGCPKGAKPVPVAGRPLLGGLVALLAGLGVWTAARRHRA